MDSGEHALIGNAAPMEGLPYGGAGTTQQIPLECGVTTTYGHIVALAGDYYGVPAEPISNGTSFSDRRMRFAKAYRTLQDADPSEMQALIAVIDSEIKLINDALNAKVQPSSQYALHPTSDAYLAGLTKGRYLSLVATNFDHFGHDALTAYMTGHRWAVEVAVSAALGRADSGLKPPTLAQAYAINAFADHFLTDLFAAGHLRQDRQGLHNWSQVGVPGTYLGAGDYISLDCHYEDGKYGLNLFNAQGHWVGYGDSRIYDRDNEAGLELAKLAARISKVEVYEAYLSKTSPIANTPPDTPVERYPSAVLPLIPDLAKVRDISTNPQHPPLFYFAADGTLMMRDDINSFESPGYSALNHVYSALTTCLQLKATYHM